MLSWRKALALLAATPFVAGCASSHLAAADEARIHTIAIVSLVPETASFTKIGLTVFNNDNATIDLLGRADPLVQSIARARVAKARPRWSVQEIPYDRAQILAKLRSFGLILTRDEGRIQKELADLVNSNHLDAIVLIVPQSADSFGIEGLGIWMRPGLISGIRFLYAHARVDLEIVGADGKAIALAAQQAASVKKLDPDALGVVPNLKDDLRPELLNRFRAEILATLEKTLNAEFDSLGF
jgi:hypothetical protein